LNSGATGKPESEPKMKVDIHTHLWPSGSTTKALNDYFAMRGLDPSHVLSAEGLTGAMTDDMELGVVSALAMRGGETNEELDELNAYVAGEVKKSGGRLIGFCTVNPFGGRESAEALKKYIRNDGFKGLKLHQNIQCFYPNDKGLYPIYEELQALRLPVLFHTGGIGIKPLQDKYSALDCIEEVACLYPDMPILLGHAGRGMYDEVALILRKHENVYADISANFAKLKGCEYLPLMELISKVKVWTGSVEKLLFGSDYPFYGEGQTLDLLEEIGRESGQIISSRDINDISFKNAGRFCEKYGLL
jgi:predicted TIM-barrel fold metal-dependent hydrolase